MDEQDFIDSLDYRFPYNDVTEAEALTQRALSISPNAAFMILHEVVRAPQDVATDAPGRTAALARLEHSFRHPLAGSLLPVARRVLQGEALSTPEAVDALERIAPYPGQYNALALVYRSSEPHQAETQATYTSIVHRWRSMDQSEDAS